MIIKSDLEACRREIEHCLGHKVRLTTNGGRRRTVVREGILEKCYPKVFMVRCIQRRTHGDLKAPRKTEMVSFSYIDVLTQVVELEVGPHAGSLESASEE
ncbi:MAG: Veg family protein [Eubacteriales bacterium]|nr:Veg family protein [Eubacteriales bacterium]